MKKVVLILLLLFGTTSCKYSNENQNRFQLHIVNKDTPEIYMIDTARGQVWKMNFDGITDERTGFYPIKIRDINRTKEFTDALKVGE